MQGIEIVRVDRRPVVELEVGSDTSSRWEMPNGYTPQVLIDHSGERASMDHGWPAFKAWSQEDHANDFLLFVIPENFLSDTGQLEKAGFRGLVVKRFGIHARNLMRKRETNL